MKMWLKIVALSAVACGALAFSLAPEAKASPWVYQSNYAPYYGGAYYGGPTVTYRRPLLAPRVAYYAPTSYYAPTTAYYAPTTAYYAPATTVYRAPSIYGTSGYAAPVYGAPTVTNYPSVTSYPGTTYSYSGATVNYPSNTTYYGGTYAPLPQPAVTYPLPTTVYPPSVFP